MSGRGRMVSASVAATLLIGLGVAPAYGQGDAGGPTILEPKPNRLLDTKRVEARVHGVGAGFSAIVRDREITNRFKPAKQGKGRVAILRRGVHVRPGRHRLVVSSGTGAARRHAARWFTVGRRQRGALRVRRVPAGRTALKVDVRGRAGRPFESVDVRLNGKRVRSRDWVVGDRTGSSSWPLGSRRFTAIFGRGDGLRYGRNRVVITAWRSDGSFDRDAVVARIRRVGPLAGAKSGATVPVGRRVRLDGRASRMAGGRRVRHRWRLVRAPAGSKAKLARAGKPRPHLVPDVSGRYRLRLRTSAGGRRATGVDEVTVYATPPNGPIGAEIETITADGSISVAGISWNFVPGWIQALELDRKTLEVVSSQTLGPPPGEPVTVADANDAFEAISEMPPTSLVILSGAGRPANVDLSDPDLRIAVENLVEVAGGMPGGISLWPETWQDAISAGHWSMLGVANTPGSATQNLYGAIYGMRAGDGSEPGAISGYLRLDNHNNFAFASANAVAIETSTDPPGTPDGVNRVKVGDDLYESDQLAAGESGFHVLIFDSLLELTEQHTYATNDGAGEIQLGVVDMQEKISETTAFGLGTPGYLVIVQSIGEPRGYGVNWVNDGALVDPPDDYPGLAIPRNDSVWYSEVTGESLAGALGQLGGATAHDHIAQMTDPAGTELNPSAAGGYTLVASTGQLFDGDSLASLAPPGPLSRNQSTSHASAPGVTGVLQRDAQSLWAVDQSAFVDDYDAASVVEVINQEPVDWPLSTTAEQQAANAWIAGEMGFDGSEVRTSYYEASGADWNSNASKVLALAYPGEGEGFSEATFDALKQQLNTEMTMVGSVQALTKDWGSILPTSTVKGIIDLQSIANAVSGAIKQDEALDQSAQSVSETYAIIGETLWVASSVIGLGDLDPVADPLGAMASIFDLASDLSSDSSGTPSNNPVEAEVADLGQDIAGNFEEIGSSVKRTGDILVSDWEKLQIASVNANGTWKWNTSISDDVSDTLETTAKAEIWKSLLPVPYIVYAVDPEYLYPDWSDPWEVLCLSSFGNGTAHVFSDSEQTPSSWMRGLAGFGDDLQSPDPVPYWYGLTTEVPVDGTGQVHDRSHSATTALTGTLFEEADPATGALGLDKLAFFADDRFERLWFNCYPA